MLDPKAPRSDRESVVTERERQFLKQTERQSLKQRQNPSVKQTERDRQHLALKCSRGFTGPERLGL